MPLWCITFYTLVHSLFLVSSIAKLGLLYLTCNMSSQLQTPILKLFADIGIMQALFSQN